MTTTTGFADQSIAKTYRRIRYLVALALVSLPLFTALAGKLYGQELQDSLSDYYFALEDGGLPRTLFVIFLAFLGGVLISYRGLDERDNLIHNMAGFFAFGVAIFPMKCVASDHPGCVPGLLPILHGPSAGLLYIAAIVSVGYGGGPRLKAALRRLPKPDEWIRRLRRIQILSALLMTVGVVTFFFHFLLKTYFPSFAWIFWIEYLGFFGFGIYWYHLMILINDANKEAAQSLPSTPAAARVESEATAPPAESWEPLP
ncbi:MAG: hypothetical protein QM776_15485 [Rhodocyclaceae bacterium]